MLTGALIAVATRSYAGWFLLAASVAITFHAAVSELGTRRRRSMGLALVTGLLIVAVLPTVISASSGGPLRQLQLSHEANAADASNLRLEQVDFTSPSGVISDLPRRVVDVLARPYPWQLSNTSQALGLVGTLCAWTLFALFVNATVGNRGTISERAGPFLYPLVFLLIAYSLTAGNAGTSFRYRTHLVILLAAAYVLVREGPAAVGASSVERGRVVRRAAVPRDASAEPA
jgi:hypothetical protein